MSQSSFRLVRPTVRLLAYLFTFFFLFVPRTAAVDISHHPGKEIVLLACAKTVHLILCSPCASSQEQTRALAAFCCCSVLSIGVLKHPSTIHNEHTQAVHTCLQCFFATMKQNTSGLYSFAWMPQKGCESAQLCRQIINYFPKFSSYERQLRWIILLL